MKKFYDLIESIFTAVLVITISTLFLFRVIVVDGGSMLNTLHHQEKLIISNVMYTPEKGDIVVTDTHNSYGKPLIKRVIATEGQWIDLEGGNVYVGEDRLNMYKVSDEFVGDVYTEEVVAGGLLGYYEYPIQVPQNHVFVLGDNRNVSLDSRTEIVGLIDCRQILGKALYRVYPIEKIGSLY